MASWWTKSACLVSALFLLGMTGCTRIPPAAFKNRGGPESLLDVSTEMVNLGLDSTQSLDQLVDWLNNDQPSRVELYCGPDAYLCEQAKMILQQFAVPFDVASDAAPRVALMYDRVLARDCDNRYIDNPINPYNLNHPTFGCATAVNMLLMVSDKRQLTAPPLSDFQDAAKSEQAIRNYLKPTEDATTFSNLVGGR